MTARSKGFIPGLILLPVMLASALGATVIKQDRKGIVLVKDADVPSRPDGKIKTGNFDEAVSLAQNACVGESTISDPYKQIWVMFGNYKHLVDDLKSRFLSQVARAEKSEAINPHISHSREDVAQNVPGFAGASHGIGTSIERRVFPDDSGRRGCRTLSPALLDRAAP